MAGLAIFAVPYLLVLAGHVALPALAPFALLLAVSGAATVVLASRRRGARSLPPQLAAALDGMPSAESMRAALRALEAELHALEDQRRTELAHERRTGGSGR